ncbi:hypothetical protein HID58_094235, partial [Brassica napus]
MCKICAREYDSCWCKDREGVPGAKNLLQKVMCANWRLDIRFEFKSDQKSHASLRTKELLGYVTFSHAGRAILSLQPMCKICAREYDSCWCKDREGVPGAKNLLQKVMCANWRLDIRFEFKSDQKSHASLRTKELLGYVTFSHAGRAILSLQ